MDGNPGEAPVHRRRVLPPGFWPLVGLGCLLVGYAWMLLTYFEPITGGVDQNGYHVCARMFNLDGVFYQKPADDLQYIGHMWVVNERGEYYPKYPVFYPALAAGMNRLLGSGGGFYATLWGAVFAVAGMYALARFWLGRSYALLAAGVMAFSPVFSTLAITKNSHTPSVAFLVWGLAAFFFAASRPSWRRIFFAFLGGALIGFTVGIRYTDFLMILVPVSYAVFIANRRWRWRLLVAVLAGAAIPYGILGLFNWHAFGAPWRTGYSLTDESSAFEPGFILENLRIYLPEFFGIVIGPVGAFALLVHRFRLRRGVFWCVWLLPTLLLYLCYYWAPDGEGTGAMRFLMPLFPATILLALLALRRILGRSPRPVAVFALALLVLVQGLWGFSRILRMAEPKAGNDYQYAFLLEALRSRLPDGALVIAGTNYLNEMDFEKRWQLYPSYILNTGAIRRTIERSLGAQAAGLQKVRAEALQKELGELSYSGLQNFLRDFFARKQAEGCEVYFLGRGNEVNQFKRLFYRHFEVEPSQKISGERAGWRLFPWKRDASRYRSAIAADTVAMPVYELVRLGPRRAKVLPALDSEQLLQQERRELFERLNPENQPELRRDLERIESIRDEIGTLRRIRREQEARAAKIAAQKETARKKEAARKEAAKKKSKDSVSAGKRNSSGERASKQPPRM